MKIENTELRMRVNELEAQLHDVTLKYEETKQRERFLIPFILHLTSGRALVPGGPKCTTLDTVVAR